MTASIVIAPIADGRLEDWRAFHDDLTGPRRGEWAESQRRRGVSREAVFLWSGPSGPAALYLVEGAEADEAMQAISASEYPFDRWLSDRLASLHRDLDFPARLSDTRPSPSGWRGWRGIRGRSIGT